MNDMKHLCDRDRERAYKDSAREVIVFAALMVGAMLGACTALFWMGVTA